MKLKPESIFRFCAVALLAAGLAWTAVNLMQANAFFEKMRNKREAAAKLQEIKKQNDRIEASFAALAAVSNVAPPLASLATAAVTGAVAEIREIDARALGRGWTVKQTEVKFNDLSLNAIAGFLRSAETCRPPWRLVECVIVSSPKADGVGSVTLTMETLARKP